MKGNKRVDFGAGFYLTGNYKQARQWAKFKEYKARQAGVINVSGVIMKYKVNVEVLEKLNCLIFKDVDLQWAEFIYANRAFDFDKFHNQEQEYDCVYGPLADGVAISIQIRELQDDEISFETFLNNIIGYKHPFPKDHQVSFHTINAIQALQLKEWKLMTNREYLVDKYIKYIITDMAEMYNIDVKKAEDIFNAYDFLSIANEYPNETFHYPPEYWAEEIYKSKSLQLS